MEVIFPQTETMDFELIFHKDYLERKWHFRLHKAMGCTRQLHIKIASDKSKSIFGEAVELLTATNTALADLVIKFTTISLTVSDFDRVRNRRRRQNSAFPLRKRE
jgi:hypothetical protein